MARYLHYSERCTLSLQSCRMAEKEGGVVARHVEALGDAVGGCPALSTSLAASSHAFEYLSSAAAVVGAGRRFLAWSYVHCHALPAPPLCQRHAHATQARAAIAVTYFADGAKVHPQLLEMVGDGELAVAGQQQGGQGSKGVAFKGGCLALPLRLGGVADLA
jgi:hypothetical protein